MSSPLIRIKRSAVAGKVPHYPSQIDLGEFAINIADGKVFIAAGTEGVGVGTTVIEVGISTENLLTGIITSTTINTTDLTVTNQISGISSGAAKVDTATDAGNQWHHVGFLDQRTGYQKLKTNGLTYNPATGKLYAGIGSFHKVTGEVTADQLSVTGVSTFNSDIHVTGSGSVGIGTDDPQRLLHLASTNPRIRLDDTDSGGYYTELRQGGSATYLHLDGDNIGSGNFRITADGGSEIFRFNDKGNVTVEGSTSSFDKNPTLDGLQLYYETDTRLATIASYDGTSGSEFSIGTNDGTSDVVEAIRIKSDGKVGIGSNTPTSKLDIAGTTKTQHLNVSGVSTFTGNADFGGNITVTSTDTGSAAAPELTLYRNSASPAPGDYLGQLMFKGENSNGGEENYAKITGKITDETLGTEDGLIETAIKGDGSFVIVSRQRSDELQLINGVGLSVDGSSTFTGDIDANGNLDVDGHTEIDNLNVSGIATISGLTYPSSDGTLNQVLTTNGNGVLSFADQSGGGGSAPVEELFTATEGQTVFTTSASTNSAYIIVYLNGIKLRSSDYTQGTSGFTLSSGAAAGDELDCIIF